MLRHQSLLEKPFENVLFLGTEQGGVLLSLLLLGLELLAGWLGLALSTLPELLLDFYLRLVRHPPAGRLYLVLFIFQAVLSILVPIVICRKLVHPAEKPVVFALLINSKEFL